MKVWSKNLTEARNDLEIQNQLVSEPFAETEKLKQKRTRYNEVMDILNPPKEEQSLDTDGGDAVQYQQRNYSDGWNSYELSDEFPREVVRADRHAFLRSLANQTKNIKNVQTRKITIYGGNTVYFFNATGYMNGNIERKLRITARNQAAISALRKEYGNVTYTSTETSDQMAEDYEMQRGRDGWDHAATGHTGVSGQNDAVDDGQSGGDSFGSYWEGFGYNTEEEFLEAIENGVMFLDDFGNIIAKEQYQQRTHALTDREVLEHAADALQLEDLTPGERNALDIFKGRLEDLRELQDQRAAQGRLYREQQFGTKVDRTAAEQTRNRMKVLDAKDAEILMIFAKT